MRLISPILFILMLVSGVAMADEKAPGSISGTVNYCGLAGLDGMQVYVPGKSFTLITDDSGQFHLHGLPAGEYTLSYRKGDKLLNQNRGIQVLAGQDSALGVIVFCDRKAAAVGGSAVPAAPMPAAQTACAADSDEPQCKDADADGVVAALDCNDNNAKVYPGAVELCDGIDNNCNGSVDDNVSVLVKNGFGACSGGAVSVMKCAKGFSNCDGDPRNGCEVDLMDDDENCGSCGNACAATESCGLGFC
jgi:Putative metal-binding motif/Carboxypeptidase regulatory-like domain